MNSIIDKGPFAPCPAPFNMAAHVLGRASAQPDKDALTVMGRTEDTHWTYAQLEAAVRGTGTGLLQLGLKAGDILLLRLGNTAEFPIAYLGAIAVGVIPVPTSSQLTLGEVEKIVGTLKPKAIANGASVPSPLNGAFQRISEANLSEMQSLLPCEYAMGDPDRMAYIIYTSGTSGRPRAVMHAHRAIWARQMMFDGWYGLQENDRLCHAGAFNWTYTLGTGLMDPWTIGATALIPEDGIAPDALPSLMKSHQASIFAAAPGVYRKILKAGAALDVPTLRHGLSAGEKLSETLRSQWQKATGREIFEAYGMSECSTFLSASPKSPATGGALGSVQTGRHIALLTEEGIAEKGAVGQIAVHRSDPGLMLGYLGAAEDTAARYRGEWFLTGDLGILSEDGQIHYQGRNDDMMNAGGYRVSPLEVEAALLSAPEAQQLTALAVSDVEIKQDVRIIAAFYTSEAEIDEAALEAQAESRLAAYKRPKLYKRIDAMPLGPNNKLRRTALKDFL
ncbi:class I adenylate-forming enzyme family protein [Lentibacter sp.]|uniref:class I adenylate-forming enzyme family protein n=1 Tax=Lentibacter sp. TaxID=2024994 RepID=UPI003F6A0B06